MHGQSTGHADGLAGYEIGVITGQECNDAWQIRGLAEAFERYGFLKTVENLLAVFAFSRDGEQQRRIGRPGANAFTTVFLAAHSRAIVLVNEIRPPLHAE
jgi:hypothetical protein